MAAYRVRADRSLELLDTTRTSPQGGYALDLSGPGPFLLIAEGGTYLDEARGVSLQLGSLPAPLTTLDDPRPRTLAALVGRGASGVPQTVHINPLTTFAVRRAAALYRADPGALAVGALRSLHADLAREFGLVGGGGDPRLVSGIDPSERTNAGPIQADPAAAAARLGLILAALSQSGSGLGDPLELVDLLALDFSDGAFDGLREGVALTLGGAPLSPERGTSGLASALLTFLGSQRNASGLGSADFKDLLEALTQQDLTSDPGANHMPSFLPLAAQSTLAGVLTTYTLEAVTPGAGESQSLTFLVSSSDPSIVPSAVVTGSGPTRSLSFTALKQGSVTLSVTIRDDGGTAQGGTDQATIPLVISVANTAPRADAQSLTTLEDTPLAITLSGVDPQGQPLTYTLSSLPTLGTLSGTAPNLTYTPSPDAFGNDSFSFRVNDGSLDSAPATVSLSVAGVNDAPSFTRGADQIVLEDAGPQTVAGWASAIAAGPNEAGQSLSFGVSNSNPSLFSVQPTVDAAGVLTYTPAGNANGSATLSVTLSDGGGTADGGLDTSPAQTFVVAVTSVNDAPSFTKGADQTVSEDAGPQSVSAWATSISPGPADESGQTLSFVLSNTNPALFATQPALSATGVLTYTPAAEAFGSATVTASLVDNGGTINGGQDAAAPQVFSITVGSANDPPSFTKGADQSVFEDAGPQSVAGWATAISAGPANEAGQALSFSLSSSNAGLFAVQPAVSAAGTLTFTPAADANGSATVTVALSDDGGTANGGADTAPSQTFLIAVTSVNDAPSFSKGADQSVPAGAGPQSVVGWATAISPGPANEAGQTLSFSVSSTNAALFVTQPALSPTGVLTYTAGGTGGSATVTVSLADDGGVSAGGVDTSPTQTFAINVAPPPPAITGFSPAPGTGVNLPVTISGSNLASATAVTFNGVDQPHFSVDSPSQISTFVPPGATTGVIQVTSPSGTATSGAFVVGVSPPVVSNYSLASSVVSGAVPLTYTVSQDQSLPVDIIVEIDTSGGDFSGPGPFVRATQARSAPGAEPYGVVAVSTSPAGSLHSFLWNSTADLPQLHSGVSIRVRARLRGSFGTAQAPLSGVTVANGIGFASPVQVSPQSGPRSAVVADFDGDGDLDLAASNSRSNTVSVLLGDGAGSFGPAVNYVVGSSPQCVRVGDLSGDGKLDLAVANAGSDHVSVLLGAGNGTFGLATNYSVGSVPFSIAIGDLNGDGAQDLAVANGSSASVSILLGAGSGAFGAPTQHAVGASPFSVLIGDVNADGALDLITANFSSDNVSVLLGDGAGAFSSASYYASGANPRSLTLGDFNRDGSLDLAIANFGSDTASILLGDGTGAFDTPVGYAVGTDPSSICSRDLDGDGRLDLAVANTGSNNITILTGTAAGTFQPTSTLTVAALPFEATVGDLDADGRLDLVVACDAGDSLSLLISTQAYRVDSALAAPRSFGVGGSPFSLALADFDADGRVDLATANNGSGTVSVRLGQGEGSFAAATSFVAGSGACSVAAGDLNADGIPDLVVANRNSDSVSVLLGTGSGGFGVAAHFLAGDGARSISLGDFNGDRSLDLAVANELSNTVSVLLGDGNGSFSAPVSFAVGSAPFDTAIGDLNGDGALDLAVSNRGSNDVSILLGTGGGSFGVASSVGVGASPFGLLVVDLDADGDLDLAVASGATDSVSVLLGTGLGTFGTLIAYPGGNTPRSLAVGDINGDGALDLTVANFSSDEVTVLLGSGAGAFGPPRGFAAEAGPCSVAVADVDGDGVCDVLGSAANADSVFVFTGSATASLLDFAPRYSVGAQPTSVAVGDLNKDGCLDMVVATPGAGAVSVLLGSGNGSLGAQATVSVGPTPFWVALEDLNRDGNLDLAVASDSSGFVSVLLGTGTGNFGAPVHFPVGGVSTSVALGDFNRDGNWDMAVAHLTPSKVSILLGDGTGAFGTATDFAIPGGAYSVAASDLNRDGNLDLAVASPGSSSLSVLLGTGTGAFGPAAAFAVGGVAYSLDLADLNGDGNTDVVLAINGGASVSVLSGAGNGAFGPALTFATVGSPRWVAVGDFNSDGKPDLAVASSGVGRISVMPGTGAGGFLLGSEVAVEGGPFSLAIGDLNEDGRLDIAVTSVDSNNVSVLLSR